jgi:tetratricopeptide (TPR) repeat protein
VKLSRALTWIVLVAAMTAGGLCDAGDPPLWDAARQPRLVRDVRALREAERAFLHARVVGGPGALLLMQEAERILERVDAASSPDPRVRFFYGRLLGHAGKDERAVKTLRDAIALAPNHPSVGEAMFALAVSLARLGRPQEEIAAYDAWLKREPSREHRAIGLSNQAEAFMVAGRLDDAVHAYRLAVDLAQDNALAHWGLAVALDRSGDPAGAIHEASVALTFDPDAKELNGPNVFFVPPRDRFWYRALGAMARANSVSDAGMRALWWDRATLLWQQYLDASPIDDRWVPIARIRHAFCEQATRAAQVRARIRRAPSVRP